MKRENKNRIPFLTRFFRAIVEDVKIPGNEKNRTCEIMKKKDDRG